MHKINEQYKYTHPHTHGMSVLTPEYTDQVVVTIKSLATGQTMKVYLDEPTQTVNGGEDLTINITSYTGHFDEEEFLITSEGFEVIGLPLMYPYCSGLGQVINTTTRVIDTENHYFSEKDSNVRTSVNLASFSIDIDLADSQDLIATGGNRVIYHFTRSGGISEDEEPIVAPVSPGAEVIPTT